MRLILLFAGLALAMHVPAYADPAERGFTITYSRTGCAKLPEGSCSSGDDLENLQSVASVGTCACGSAAYAAGLRVDDAILSIDGIKIDGLSSDEFWDLLNDAADGRARVFVILRKKGSELIQHAIRFRPLVRNPEKCEDA